MGFFLTSDFYVYILKTGKIGTIWDKMLSGSHKARFDSSGRLKIPEKYRSAIEDRYGKEVFITSLTNESIQIYPWPVWEQLTGFATQGLLQLKPELRRFKIHVNRKGSHQEIDSKGRILINQELRDIAKLDGEVELVGLHDHIEIWNKELLDQMLEDNPLSDNDFERLSELTPKE